MAAPPARTGPDDSRSSGPCCTSTTATPGAATAADMAAVIARVLMRTAPTPGRETVATARSAPWSRATGAAQQLLPAVLALGRLTEHLVSDGAFESDSAGQRPPERPMETGAAGLIHRRCRIAPVGAQAPDDRPQEPGAGGTEVGLRRTARGGWELLQGAVVVRDAGPAWPAGARVTHDLARRTPPTAPPVPTGPHPPGADTDSALRDVDTPGTLTITAADVRAWADATGDHNPIHLHPGAAHRAGLAVGEQELVAHGLLLGALSLALTPTTGVVDLRFPGPAALPVDGVARLGVLPASGLTIAGRTVLVRR
ncbi:hypothetical protein DRB06_02785 [Actinomyces sp. Z5]|nr:hypothetical protein DRB06_02785 [Actinomyces sp. Z5]